MKFGCGCGDSNAPLNPINYVSDTKTCSTGSVKWIDIIGIPNCITDCTVLEQFIINVTGAGTALTFQNGLSQVGQIIELGGPLIKNTTVIDNVFAGIPTNFIIGDALNASPHAFLKIKSDPTFYTFSSVNIGAVNPSVNTDIGFFADQLGFSVYHTINGSTYKEIASYNVGITVQDAVDNKGLLYMADYSAGNTGGSFNPRWIPDLGYLTNQIGNGGLFSANGNGINLVFSIPHGLTGTPTKISVTAGSQDAANFEYVTANATHIMVNYNVAPIAGVNNVSLYWTAKL